MFLKLAILFVLLPLFHSGAIAAPRFDSHPPPGKGGNRPPPPGFGAPHFPYPPQAGAPPDYLMEVSEKARNEHFQLLTEMEEKPKAQLNDELAKWAEKSGVKEEYEKYTDDHEKKRKAFHTLIADNLAGDALNAFDKIWDITENDQLSRSAECREINTVLEEMKLKIRQLVPLMMPQITGPPPAGCFPRFGQSPQFHHKMGGGGNGEKSNSSEEKKH